MNVFRLAAGIALLGATASIPAPPEAAAQQAAAGPTTTVTAGERYRASPLRRWLLGAHYRDLWTTPIQVELLDLDTQAGGLTPLRRGGGAQTRSLRLRGADGREYVFRSADKDPSRMLDTVLHETLVEDVVQDAISAAHPFGALVAAPLLDAVDVLNVDPQLRVMPDHPALREFRQEFGGMLGFIEERPDENQGERTAFRGTARVIGTGSLVERLDRGPDDRVDAHQYLKARLMDVFLGDWDRHRDQWRWATFDTGGHRSWLPVPRDRDYAFAKFDGVAPWIVGLYVEQIVRFAEEYPSMARLHWNARELDRRLLSGLDRRAWDSVGASVRAGLTDSVIDLATRRLPTEIYALSGEALAGTLRVRRDRLPEAWDELYHIVSDRVDLHGTDSPDVVVVDRGRDGTLTVTLAARVDPDHPYLTRRFTPGETREVRVYLEGGNDSTFVRGDARGSILLRVIGGPGDDRFELRGGGERVRLYDHEGDNAVRGDQATDLDDTRFEEWVWAEDSQDPPLDWGGWTYPVFWSSFSSDLGLFIGGGARVERYGFRKRLYSRAFDVRAGYAPAVGKGRVELSGRFNAENSPLFWLARARVSRLDVLHYYGLGNTTATGGRSYHQVDLTSTSATLGVGLSPDETVEVTLSATVRRSSTRQDPDRYFGTLGEVYGSGSFLDLGVAGTLEYDPFVRSLDTGNRFRLRLEGAVFPELLDVASSFGRVGGEVSGLLASSPWPRLSAAVRAGARLVTGRFPWHAAAFLGGTSTVRGLDEERFAGDAASWVSAEVRLRAWTPKLILPTAVGLLGFTDLGRVWLDGESPGGWHRSTGGGLFLRPMGQPYMIRLGAASSDEATKLFAMLGLTY